ncbi:protocatechuate 4,5-dioxygenase subunit alpha [Hyphococcus luteus]|uniref:Protocatechuate 4,5-dioxygenase subunit alpha n=1 Tax=Hyphococcus luteus TaxID=2058213 RepID=A0A2S7K583_9PROT|nr:protocatechuate 4,5-dioxygenase subunit alpha [Marinicaulis flavus]PQA87641.1 protocatechuate 4,5-dioxygenase subunit alpha [Marinicaulis flavus]
MDLERKYRNVPGTTVFDSTLARKGYHLNQVCASLLKDENRQRFRANERAYLDEWKLTEEQKQAVLDRDYNRMIALGGNVYYLAKIFSSDGLKFTHVCAQMCGMTEEDYIQMMNDGGRAPAKEKNTGD